MDIVLDAKLIRRLKKRKSYGAETVYMRVNGEEYRCILKRVSIVYPEDFVSGVTLVEYVPGKPNKLTIPVELTHFTENPYLQRRSDFEHKIE